MEIVELDIVPDEIIYSIKLNNAHYTRMTSAYTYCVLCPYWKILWSTIVLCKQGSVLIPYAEVYISMEYCIPKYTLV